MDQEARETTTVNEVSVNATSDHSGLTTQDESTINATATLPEAENGFDLAFPGKFLDMTQLVAVLMKPGMHASNIIPTGLKENKYYRFDNKSNLEHGRKKQKCRYWDDCGAWVSRATNATILILNENEALVEIVFKNGQYGIMQQRSVNGNRKATFEPLEREPDMILTVHRAYATHSLSSG